MKTLEELYEKIEDQIDRTEGLILVGPYSHNIIGLSLSIIARDYGHEAAEEAIKDFNLKEHGWR